mmetsp:Transcript_79819/g.185347  ORF Transcript_79819/g.185347 Transcript_79819/m.185347 type:complete len:103 (-) Transcript_79819:990-1298(-)
MALMPEARAPAEALQTAGPHPDSAAGVVLGVQVATALELQVVPWGHERVLAAAGLRPSQVPKQVKRRASAKVAEPQVPAKRCLRWTRELLGAQHLPPPPPPQ